MATNDVECYFFVYAMQMFWLQILRNKKWTTRLKLELRKLKTTSTWISDCPRHQSAFCSTALMWARFAPSTTWLRRTRSRSRYWLRTWCLKWSRNRHWNRTFLLRINCLPYVSYVLFLFISKYFKQLRLKLFSRPCKRRFSVEHTLILSQRKVVNFLEWIK